jgi:hypothetical protein
MEEGLPELVDAPGGPAIRYRGRFLYSDRLPRALPERSALSFISAPKTLVICPSPLLGYGLAALLARMDGNSALLCVEAERALFDLSVKTIDAGVRADPRFTLAFLSGDGALSSGNPDMSRFRKCSRIALSGGYALHRDGYDRLIAVLEAEIGRYWFNRATLAAMGRLWTRNLVANLTALPSSLPLAAVKEAARGKPIALCGAGSSLEGSLSLLARMRGRVFIVAADTALGALSASGIETDAIVCLEAQVHNARDFLGHARLPRFLIADLTSHPAPLRIPNRGLCLVSSAFAPIALLSRMAGRGLLPEELPALGSVGVAALRIALAVRDPSMPVLVSGLDFSFEPGKTHARGTAPHAAALSRSWRLSQSASWNASVRHGTRKIKGIGPSGSLITDPALSGYAGLFRAEAAPFSPCLRDIREKGLDLGIREFPPVEESARALDGPMPSLLPASRSVPGARDVLDFAEGELSSLRSLRDALAGKTAMDEGVLASLLESLDYLYVHFPDGGRLPVLERHFLARVSVEADSFIPRLSRAAESLRASAARTTSART